MGNHTRLIGKTSVSVLLASVTLVFAGNRPQEMVVAVVDGQKLTVAELEQKSTSALFQARNALYQAERKATEALVDEFLLARQAKKENLSVEELIKRNVKGQIGADPSDEALRVYYEGVNTTESFEAVRSRIIDIIRERRQAKAKDAYLAKLRAAASIAIRIGPPRLDIAVANAPTRGNPKASVTFIEFADYECAYCQQIHPAISKLQAEYKDKVKFAFKDLPLPMHAQAQKAAEAAHCAGAQGKYWEYQDALFTTKQLDRGSLEKHAHSTSLDVTAFGSCLDSSAKASVVKANLDEAQSLGLPGTPAIFVNGRFIEGAVDYDTLRRIVEEELALSQTAKDN